jgi:hypothetical protein
MIFGKWETALLRYSGSMPTETPFGEPSVLLLAIEQAVAGLAMIQFLLCKTVTWNELNKNLMNNNLMPNMGVSVEKTLRSPLAAITFGPHRSSLNAI